MLTGQEEVECATDNLLEGLVNFQPTPLAFPAQQHPTAPPPSTPNSKKAALAVQLKECSAFINRLLCSSFFLQKG